MNQEGRKLKAETKNLNREGSYPKQWEVSQSRQLRESAAGPDLTSLGDYELHFEREGFASIRQISSGEIMHLRTSPIEEARTLYVGQAGLGQLLVQSGKTIVLWDVGLGAAANAIAAIECYEQRVSENGLAPLTIISFENNLDSLALAFRHLEEFPYLRHPAPADILRQGNWRSETRPALSWLLVPGDFAQTVSTISSSPDVIFYDMFSAKSGPGHWTPEIFRQLFAACEDRATRLVTYSRSTSARAALLAAGFHVARGRPSGAQEESTIALTPAAALAAHSYELLDASWLGKWERSRAKFPIGLAAGERPAFEELIRNHRQFQFRADVELLGHQRDGGSAFSR